MFNLKFAFIVDSITTRLAQLVERTALNRVVVGSIPTVGETFFFLGFNRHSFFLYPWKIFLWCWTKLVELTESTFKELVFNDRSKDGLLLNAQIRSTIESTLDTRTEKHNSKDKN